MTSFHHNQRSTVIYKQVLVIVVGGFDMVAKETGSVLIELIGLSKGRNENLL